jgi:hypothetical protein
MTIQKQACFNSKKSPLFCWVFILSVKCAECPCIPQDCSKVLDAQQRCILCTKDVCCCASIHSRRYYPTVKKPLTLTYTRTALEPDDCYRSASVSCKNNNTVLNRNATSSQSSSSSSSGLFEFLRKNIALFAAALGIEILCIAAAEIGENTGLYLFGSDLAEIPIAYAMRYVLAGFIIFATILGRYNYSSYGNIDSCFSVLAQGAASLPVQPQDYF